MDQVKGSPTIERRSAIVEKETGVRHSANDNEAVHLRQAFAHPELSEHADWKQLTIGDLSDIDNKAVATVASAVDTIDTVPAAWGEDVKQQTLAELETFMHPSDAQHFMTLSGIDALVRRGFAADKAAKVVALELLPEARRSQAFANVRLCQGAGFSFFGPRTLREWRGEKLSAAEVLLRVAAGEKVTMVMGTSRYPIASFDELESTIEVFARRAADVIAQAEASAARKAAFAKEDAELSQALSRLSEPMVFAYRFDHNASILSDAEAFANLRDGRTVVMVTRAQWHGITAFTSLDHLKAYLVDHHALVK